MQKQCVKIYRFHGNLEGKEQPGAADQMYLIGDYQQVSNSQEFRVQRCAARKLIHK